MRILSGLKTIGRSSWRDKALLAEAGFVLVLASIAIRLVPFKRIAQVASAPTGRLLPQEERLPEIRRIRWAVVAWADRVPWRAMCFERGLSVHWMIRRRGVPSIMHYGAVLDPDEGLLAHVWIKDGDVPIIGCESESRFRLLASFPGTPA
ncbi:MAG: lasso peptide biosynthesis B2 protein [Alphaproteobacteria bacterium]|nr:lasso peptide biosynthesis B2 protein [Alphaproteobacteria bacterium]